MSIGEVLADAWRIYQRLIRRSIIVAGLIFAVVGLADALAARVVELAGGRANTGVRAAP